MDLNGDFFSLVHIPENTSFLFIHSHKHKKDNQPTKPRSKVGKNKINGLLKKEKLLY